MENLGLVSSPKIVMGLTTSPRKSVFSSKPYVGLPDISMKTDKDGRNPNPGSSFLIFSLFHGHEVTETIVPGKVVRDCFASIASSSGQETSSIGVNPLPSVPPPAYNVTSPLLWIAVGVGLSALCSWGAGQAKKYAMEQSLKLFTQQMSAPNNPFGYAAISPGSPFPCAPSSTLTSDSSRTSTPVASQPLTEDTPATSVDHSPSVPAKDNVQPVKGPKKYAFADVSLEETFGITAFETNKKPTQVDSPNDLPASEPVSQDGTRTKQGIGASEAPSTNKTNPLMSVEALEKLMDDPTVQKMVYSYLPEEMRNPAIFKLMLQNPQYHQQLQDMLNDIRGSPEAKQQLDRIGLSPEEVMSKIMANPDVAMAFQNPRIRAAIFDCSQNPLSIAQYKNDKEVMDVFCKILQLFPGLADS